MNQIKQKQANSIMSQFPIKQFTVVQPILEDFNTEQKSYKEFIYPTHTSFNLKSILIKQNLEYYYGIQIEMNYRIIIGVLEKLLQDLEDEIYYSGLREEDIWIRIRTDEGQQINLQGIFNFDIEFSVIPTDDYDNAITQNEFQQILKSITNKSEEVYVQIDPENQDIIHLLYNNLLKLIDIINYHEQISSYSYELFTFFVNNSPKNPLIWSLENNEWNRYLKTDIFKNDLITDLLSNTIEQNQNTIQQIRDPEIQRLTIELIALNQLNCQPNLNKKLDDIILYQAFYNNPLIGKFKGDFLKQLIEINFFDQNSLHQDYKEFIQNRIQVQTQSSNFIDRLEIECIITCLNNSDLQKHQLFEQRKDEMYKQNIRNYINSFIYRIQENQIQSFEVQYTKSHNHWIERFEENVTKFETSDDALIYVQTEISSLFNQNIEYLEANYMIGFDFNDLFIDSIDDFQNKLQELQLDFESNPNKFRFQQCVQQHLPFINQQYKQKQANQYGGQQFNQQEQQGFTKNSIPQNTPPILITPLSSVQSNNSQISLDSPNKIYSANYQQYLGNPLENSVIQEQNQIILPPQNNNQSPPQGQQNQIILPPQNNNQSPPQGQQNQIILPPQNNNQSPPQGQFNLAPSSNLGPPQSQSIQQDIYIGNPLDQTVNYQNCSNISRITESVNTDEDNIYSSEVVQKPIVNEVVEIIKQSITQDDQLRQKLIEFIIKYKINRYQAQTFIPNIVNIMKFPTIYITQIFKETQSYHKIQQNVINFDYHSQQWNQTIQEEEFLKALLQQKQQAFQYATKRFLTSSKLLIDAMFQEQARQSIPIVNEVVEIVKQSFTQDNQLRQKLIEFIIKYKINRYQAQTFIPNIVNIMKFPTIYITQIFKETQNYHKIQQNVINFDYHSQQWNQTIQEEEFLKALLQQKQQAFQYANKRFLTSSKLLIDAMFQEQARQSIQK